MNDMTTQEITDRLKAFAQMYEALTMKDPLGHFVMPRAQELVEALNIAAKKFIETHCHQ